MSSPASIPASCHVCPWWLGYLMASPLRRVFERPERLLGPVVKSGMTVLDFGCAMGFFSLPLARMVGPEGRVICVDLQPKMIDVLRRRARRAGLDGRIEARVCSATDVRIADLAGTVDLVAAIHVVHETPDVPAAFAQLRRALKPNGRLLLIEPKGHVSSASYTRTLEHAAQQGFIQEHALSLRRSRGNLLAAASA